MPTSISGLGKSMDTIKVLHLADIHIGMENYGRLDSQSGLNSRVLDFLRRMSEAIDGALEREVDLCIFAGDAYKNQRPNPTLQREFARRIKRLSDAGVPTLLLVGNHDMSTADRAASSIDIFQTLNVPNTIVANREKLHTLTCRRGQKVQIAAVPYPQRSRLLNDDRFRKMKIEELDRALAEIMAENIAALAKDAQQNPDLPTIFTGHFSVSTATLGSEQSVMLGRDVVVMKDQLAHPAWDYVALGHIHKHQSLNKAAHPPIIYPGSLERIDFGEEKETKGYVIADVAKGKSTWEFIPVKSRKFTTIRADVRKSSDPMTMILDKIDEFHINDAVVRVIIKATEEQDPLIEDRIIRQNLKDAGYVAGIKHDVDRHHRRRLRDANVESLTPVKALSHYFESAGIEKERQSVLLKHAENLINEA